MNRTNKLIWLIAALFFLNFTQAKAQTKDDLFTGMTDITWLGLDFTQSMFIGDAHEFKDHGEITNQEMRDKYIPGWNYLFTNEPKKYDVAKQVHRTQVSYAIEVSGKPNGAINKDFFTMDMSKYSSLDASKVEALVRKYDFQGKKGIGMIIFVEGMNKAKEEASGWCAFVNMEKKTVLISSHVTGKPGGFGFRNYWAKAFLNMVKNSDYKDWK